MTVITVTLPDGAALQLADGATGHDAAAAIGPGLAKAALAVKVDGEIRDLARPLPDGAAIAIITPKSGDDYLYVLRHTAAHVLAEAVQDLFPGTKFGFGPPIEDGFYYDFELPRPLSEEDFPAIETAMRKVIKQRAASRAIRAGHRQCARVLCDPRPGLQGRSGRVLGRSRRVHGLAVPAERFRGSLPGSPPA